MDNVETNSETNAKISDSAYSNSCSNSQSRRSHSSKSTHSGSNSSGSSGYGGQQSSASHSSNLLEEPKEKRIKEKDTKKKNYVVAETPIIESAQEQEHGSPQPTSVFAATTEEPDVVQTTSPGLIQTEKSVENMEISMPEQNTTADEVISSNARLDNNIVCSRDNNAHCIDGFSCVISMDDGVVMYTTSSVTGSLGFPKDMWIGRSFIDFVHPKDRCTFASQITNGLAAPKNATGTIEKDQIASCQVSTMFCRIRRYRGLGSGFSVKERIVTFMPFLLRLSFKNVNDDEGHITYLVIQATPFFSAFKIPCEVVAKAVPFVMRHVSNGNLEYIDPESVPYLGYLPQDVINKDTLQLYHPEDLTYLQQVYQLIVKEGGVPRSKPYRMLTQNGDYLKLETEWSSFINPWSRKLEFVIAKHTVLEGPLNPDVFQTPECEKAKMSDEEKARTKILRDNIIRTMNEVLTRPAEFAKQQMSKRCQDLASFMESLMEEQPKAEDELRVDIQEPDHSYYERDSVMLGGISPHHEYNDSKSSTETPVSYNQLNYNETLQRYFDSHEPLTVPSGSEMKTDDLLLTVSKPKSKCLSPIAANSGDSGDIGSSIGSSGFIIGSASPYASLGDYQSIRLTESLLIKHNTEMEKHLVKKHRGNRSSHKLDREKISSEMRLKKKEHLARCNAAFQPTTAISSNVTEFQPHGVKRASKQLDEDEVAHKHHRGSPRQTRRKQANNASTSQMLPAHTTTVPPPQWPTPSMNSMNGFMPGMMHQQMPMVNPVATVTDMFPMYYMPTAGVSMPSGSDLHCPETSNATGQYTPSHMPYMMYGQTVFGSPLVYSPINAQMPFSLQQPVMPQGVQYNSGSRPLELKCTNYEEEAEAISSDSQCGNQNSDMELSDIRSSNGRKEGEAISSDSQGANQNSAMDLSDIRSSNSRKTHQKTQGHNKATTSRMGNSEEVRTDGESSYSSFYSSFFKTESGSAEDSGDNKKTDGLKLTFIRAETDPKTRPKRKIEPPWMEKVCVTPELIYKYQVSSKSIDDVLSADKEKISKLEQPAMVNEQLGQLYLDLQLEGVAARLTLEEGITSSGSSGEETINNPTQKPKDIRRKREYGKLVMIYEEDAPLPSPTNENENTLNSTA